MKMTLKQITSTFILLCGVGMCMATFMTPWVYANPKVGELERKMADLTLLHQQLEDRLNSAHTIRSALDEQQIQLKSEILLLTKSMSIKTFQQATEHLRLHYNIELLRTVMTYMDELDAKILFYQTGRDRLSYLKQLAEDDIRMITALNDLKIDALTTQISLVINRYLPEAHNIQIDPQEVNLISTRQVWDRVVKTP